MREGERVGAWEGLCGSGGGDLAGPRMVPQNNWCNKYQTVVYLHLKFEMKKISKHGSATIIMRTRSDITL